MAFSVIEQNLTTNLGKGSADTLVDHWLYGLRVVWLRPYREATTRLQIEGLVVALYSRARWLPFGGLAVLKSFILINLCAVVLSAR